MAISDFLGGIKNDISSGIDEAKQAASDAVDTVEQKASAAIDTVEQKASDAVDYAKEKGAEVEDGAKKAAQWAGHQYDSFASALQSKLNPGAGAGAPGDVEGGGVYASTSPETMDLNKPVDLGSRDGINKFLAQWGQIDKEDDTTTDSARCQSNTALAGLLMTGGTAKLADGLKNAAAEAKRNADDPSCTAVEKKRYQEAAKTLGEAADAAAKNKITPGQMDHAADAIFKTFAQRDAFDAKGNLAADGMSRENIEGMEKTLGLTGGRGPEEIDKKSELNPLNWFKSAKQERSENVWDDIKPGETAHVGVNWKGDLLEQWKADPTTKAPNGADITENSRDGCHYFKDGDRYVKLEDDSKGTAGHAVLFGRDKEGSRYIYNPEGSPPLVSEKSDPKKFDQLSTDLMGKDNEGRTPVTKYS